MLCFVNYYLIFFMKQKKPNLKIVGEYELNLDKKLGEGMSCVVYEAYDTLRHEFVAIKMIQRGNSKLFIKI